MLIFNLKRVTAMRGIGKLFSFLCKLGFVYSTAYSIDKGAIKSLKITHIQKLCVALNCTPNDLFEWQPAANSNLPADHALNSLIKENQKPVNVSAILREIPLEKMPEVENLLKSLMDG